MAAKRAVGYLPETPPLYPEMRVEDYVRYVATLHDVPRRERGAKVEHALESCGLAEVPGRVIRTLSKGFRQRVGLAQAIVHDPDVLVLDEPTSGLDPRADHGDPGPDPLAESRAGANHPSCRRTSWPRSRPSASAS